MSLSTRNSGSCSPLDSCVDHSGAVQWEASSAGSCCDLCQQAEGCKYFSFLPEAEACFLIYNDDVAGGSGLLQEQCVSGAVESASSLTTSWAPVEATCGAVSDGAFAFLSGRDDYNPVDSPEGCCSLCEQSRDCCHVTFGEMIQGEFLCYQHRCNEGPKIADFLEASTAGCGDLLHSCRHMAVTPRSDWMSEFTEYFIFLAVVVPLIVAGAALLWWRRTRRQHGTAPQAGLVSGVSLLVSGVSLQGPEAQAKARAPGSQIGEHGSPADAAP